MELHGSEAFSEVIQKSPAHETEVGAEGDSLEHSQALEPPANYRCGRRKRIECVKSKGKVTLVYGEDLMDEVADISGRTVIGRVRGRRFGVSTLSEWVESNWAVKLGYSPTFMVLLRGWFAFQLKNAEDAQWVLLCNWSIDSNPMALKLWTPLFDPRRERFDVEAIWVRLPGLPKEFWSPSIFKDIGNSLGVFLEADMSFEVSGDMSLARILVKIDMREDLATEMKISTSNGTHVQTLDYEGVPFRCFRCYAYDHLVEQCHLPDPKDTSLKKRNAPLEGKEKMAPVSKSRKIGGIRKDELAKENGLGLPSSTPKEIGPVFAQGYIADPYKERNHSDSESGHDSSA